MTRAPARERLAGQRFIAFVYLRNLYRNMSRKRREISRKSRLSPLARSYAASRVPYSARTRRKWSHWWISFCFVIVHHCWFIGWPCAVAVIDGVILWPAPACIFYARSKLMSCWGYHLVLPWKLIRCTWNWEPYTLIEISYKLYLSLCYTSKKEWDGNQSWLKLVYLYWFLRFGNKGNF